jgi:hypothetical protein
VLEGCERVDLKFGEVLAESGEPIRHVYFPTRCAIVLITLLDERASVEVGLVGNEGVLGTALASRHGGCHPSAPSFKGRVAHCA